MQKQAQSVIFSTQKIAYMALDERFGNNDLSKEENIGGLLQLRLVQVPNIVEFDIQLGGVNLTYSAFEDFYFSESTARFREPSRLTDQGAQNNAELTVVSPRDRTELRNFLNDNAEVEFICIFTDRNSERWVMGTDTQAAQKAEALSSGEIPSQRNGYTIKFVAQTGQKKYEVLSETVVTATNFIFQDNNNWIFQDGNNAIAQETV